METCATLGMLSPSQARDPGNGAGLDYYNHNLDTSPDYYGEIITSRSYQDRLDTLGQWSRGGHQRLLRRHRRHGRDPGRPRPGCSASSPIFRDHPDSVPINNLVQVEGTPLHGVEPLPPVELARCIAVARIMMPESVIRLSAGRTELSDEAQALCFMAGAGSIFCGDQLLTTPNPSFDDDMAMFADLGLSRRNAPATRGG